VPAVGGVESLDLLCGDIVRFPKIRFWSTEGGGAVRIEIKVSGVLDGVE
jgi:hypothetical protein